MADETESGATRGELAAARPEKVMQVERHDYPDLAPQGGKRMQAMRGFDPIYTDIVDYIVRCTHKIWDERDIGLIYSHYTHNCVLYGTTGTLYTREEVVRDTIQRLVSFPERRGMATHASGRGTRMTVSTPRISSPAPGVTLRTAIWAIRRAACSPRAPWPTA